MSTRRALLFTLLLIVGTNIVRSTTIPDRFHFAYNLAIAAIVGLIAVAALMTSTELGLARSSLGEGAIWGLGAFAAISSVVALAVLLPGIRTVFVDDRADVAWRSMVWRVGVVIPLGTVLVEELVFRGVLLGLLRRTIPTARAIAIAAVVFGLWHVFPILHGGPHYEDASTVGRWYAAFLTLIATTVAGVGFGWLRVRSRSLLAPIGAHLATNSVVFAAAWVVTNR